MLEGQWAGQWARGGGQFAEASLVQPRACPPPLSSLACLPSRPCWLVQVAYKPDESTCLGLYIPLEAAENREEVEQYQERHLKRQADMAASAGQKVPGQVGGASVRLLL